MTSCYWVKSVAAPSPGDLAKAASQLMVSMRCWAAVRSRVIMRLCVLTPGQVRFPPHTLRLTTAGRTPCSACQLVAGTSGSSQEGEERVLHGIASAFVFQR